MSDEYHVLQIAIRCNPAQAERALLAASEAAERALNRKAYRAWVRRIGGKVGGKDA